MRPGRRRTKRRRRRSRSASSPTSAASTTVRSTTCRTRACSARPSKLGIKCGRHVLAARQRLHPEPVVASPSRATTSSSGSASCMAHAIQQSRRSSRTTKFAIIDMNAIADFTKRQDHQERRGPDLRGAGGRLPRRLPRRPRGEAARRQRPSAAVGGVKIPPVDPLHRRLPGRREGGRPGHQGAERLLAGLRHAGQVQERRARTRSPGLRTSSSRSPAAAASARSTRRRRRASGASASTPTSGTSARTS